MTKNMRPVRSYVLRQGRMTEAQTKAIKELWSLYGLEKDQLLNIQAPTILEIGFGTGQSLAIQAKSHPENYYLGIEVHQPGVGSLLHLIHKEKLSNIKIFCADAIDVLENAIPHHSLSKIQIFFPDPWPKKRHHKRRLIQENFLKLIHQKLKPEGILHIATDWENYAEHILEVTQNSDLFEKVEMPIDRPLTKFEARGKKLGHGVWDLIFKSKLSPSLVNNHSS